jgi:hypothetical protein
MLIPSLQLCASDFTTPAARFCRRHMSEMGKVLADKPHVNYFSLKAEFEKCSQARSDSPYRECLQRVRDSTDQAVINNLKLLVTTSVISMGVSIGAAFAKDLGGANTAQIVNTSFGMVILGPVIALAVDTYGLLGLKDDIANKILMPK